MSISGSSAGDGSANGVCFPASGDPENGQQGGLQDDSQEPILDLSVLRELEEELGGTGVAHNFARDYISIWDKRLRYLERSVEDNDPDAAMDAALSLKNSALMIGATRLARLAIEVQRLVKCGDLVQVRQLLPAVERTGELTVSELKLGYLPPDS
ncbi:Hpt domain-containing protein [Arthrobacter sp. ZGTC131]|uniref:Hpt domain-containing protein n=1 Tax=Arthrobacter sp. ZGTC131 TaxID=2058898 RepID=UPI000CE4DB5C|nr:Hpt domain-containing protein [Arthrobacter sp. ZGTC131]